VNGGAEGKPASHPLGWLMPQQEFKEIRHGLLRFKFFIRRSVAKNAVLILQNKQMTKVPKIEESLRSICFYINDRIPEF
jgi:hypothetical protein